MSLFAFLSLPLLAADPTPPVDLRSEAQNFLDFYTAAYVPLYTAVSEAQWEASTHVSAETEGRRTGAAQAMAAFVGNAYVVEHSHALLTFESRLDPLQVRQLKMIVRMAADSPGTLPEVVQARIAAESHQASVMDGFVFCLEARAADGSCPHPKTANDIDDVLADSTDMDARLQAWQASKQIGVDLKPGLVNLRDLRNKIAREMHYSSFFAMQVDDYGMSTDEMMTVLDDMVTDIGPLYGELQKWSLGQLAKKYKQPIPKGPAPAQWYPNRWAQEWTGLVKDADLSPYFKDRSSEWIVQQAEDFYVSMGFEPLPKSFWERSDLYPVPEGDPRQKNAHASAWHMDLNTDIRSLMSVQPNAEWFFTAHHELGHIYYYESYSRPEVPPLLREGANRAFHEAVGELASLAAGQIPYLKGRGFLPKNARINTTQAMLVDALERTVVFLPWSAGVMSRFEYELYEKDLPPEQWQSRWWELVAKYQYIIPPNDRNDLSLCDACTKTHINDDPAAYYDYALATVIKYQLHDHIARVILKKDPHACDYYGNKAVGDYLKGILSQGATRDWRDILRDATGEEFSTRAMVEYYKPLMTWLKAENRAEHY